MKTKKRHLKSVRLSDEVLAYVEGFEGDGFNQKFENLVLFCMQASDAKRTELAYLNERIQSKRIIISKIDNCLKMVVSIQRELDKTLHFCNRLFNEEF